jgi:hypothetical protein
LDYGGPTVDSIASPDADDLITSTPDLSPPSPLTNVKVLIFDDWSRAKVAANKHRPDFVAILNDLKQYRVPITGIFGTTPQVVPAPLKIVVGSGVSYSDIMTLVAICESKYPGSIESAWWNAEPGDFDDTVWFGAYGPPQCLQLAQVKEFIAEKLVPEDNFFKLIGKGAFPYDP